MKHILYTVCLLIAVSCNNKTANSAETPESNKNEQPEKAAIAPINPCDLFNKEQLTTVFSIVDSTTIEMFARDKYGDSKQCQFIWPDEKESIQGSQIMIDISSKTPDMGATFSRMLELDKQNGLTARENNETIIIMPTSLQGFGDHAYHWEQIDFQSVQKITFHVRNEYRIDITYNAHKHINMPKEEVKNKLIQIGKIIKQKL